MACLEGCGYHVFTVPFETSFRGRTPQGHGHRHSPLNSGRFENLPLRRNDISGESWSFGFRCCPGFRICTHLYHAQLRWMVCMAVMSWWLVLRQTALNMWRGLLTSDRILSVVGTWGALLPTRRQHCSPLVAGGLRLRRGPRSHGSTWKLLSLWLGEGCGVVHQ